MVTDPTTATVPDLAAVARLAPEQVPAVLAQVAAEQARLAAVQAALAARLTVAIARDASRPADPDVTTDAHEVAVLIHRSVSWVRKRGHILPGFRQPGGKGCKVAWSRAALKAWVAGGC